MAFSQSIKRGQVPISCNLCEVETKISSKCLDCDLLMCSKCKDKIHPKFKNAKNHEITDIKEIGSHQVQPDHGKPDFSNINCQEHSGQILFMFCKSCDQLVCPICIAKIHNGHELVPINEEYDMRIERLKERQEKVSADLDELTRKELKIKEIQKNENFKYQDVKQRIKEQNTALKKAVDQYTEDLMKELDQKWTELQNETEGEINKINERKKTLQEQNTKINNLMTTDEVQSDIEQLFISKDRDKNKIKLKMGFDPIPVFIAGEINLNNFGLLQKPSNAVNITVSKSFTTELPRIDCLLQITDDLLWINCNHSPGRLQKVIKDGNKMIVISRYPVQVFGMALTPSNDPLLLIKESTLQTISRVTGKVVDTNYTVAPLLPTGVHVTRQNKVLIGARSGEKAFPVTGKRVLIVMDIQGRQELTFEYDKNHEPLFSYIRHITETRKGRLFVVDNESYDFKGRVVVLGQNGDVINIYKGHPDINCQNTSLKPTDIACTPLDNVIVVDLSTQILHILNNSGHLIKYYKVSDLGILRPLTVAYTASRSFYIGCSKEVGSTKNQAKLYEVKIPGC